MKRIFVKDPYDVGLVTLRSARLMLATMKAVYKDALKKGNAAKAQHARVCVRSWNDAIMTAVKLALSNDAN